MADRLDPIFNPRSIAIIGASRHRGKVGYMIMRNLITNEYQGKLFPVNPNADSVWGIKAYPSVLDVPDTVDLAIITIPADLVLPVVEQCARKGVKGLVVITAGFREIGPVGEDRERRLKEVARKHGIALVGPNCMGVINTHPEVQMDATFAPTPPLRGHLSFLSQSGALGVAILDHAKSLQLGFAKFVSLGNKADVSGNDCLLSWEHDPETRVILMYLENFGNPKNFARIARRLTKKKPVIAVKAGRTEAGGRATVSHTGALGGSDIAADAIFAQTGVMRANSIEELFDYAMAFARQPLPRGKRVAIITDAGGPAIMCTDFLIQQGMEMATLSESTVDSMREWAPPEASLRNPVDLIASAGPEEYRQAVKAVLKDPSVDALIVIYVPPIVTEEVAIARAIIEGARGSDKPVLCNFLGRSEDSPGFVELVQHTIPSYLFPESAALTVAMMYRYREYLERDEGEFPKFDVDREAAKRILARAKAKGWSRLPELEAMDLLRAYGLQIATTKFCRDAQEAEAAAGEIGYPVALKAIGAKLVHKTEYGAVALDIRGSEELRDACGRMEKRLHKAQIPFDGFLVQEFVRGGKETILGMNRDKVFGPLIAFGLGGIYVEWLKDVAFGLAPMTDMDARRMIRSIRTYPLLEGVRGEKPSDVDALQEALLRLSALVTDADEINEVDLNPVAALENGKGYKVIDARIVL
ncbi:MAG TPA: acetate--CoA ligase family protein [Thermoplasmata archaeon]|nr:acetate--CoA ligase family protein [Thermoplasmata archaeon]